MDGLDVHLKLCLVCDPLPEVEARSDVSGLSMVPAES